MEKQISKAVKPTELNRLIAKEMGSDNPDLAQKWINAIIKVIADELVMAGKVQIRNLGTFTTVEAGGKDKDVYNNGIVVRTYIEPHYNIKFRCSNTIKDVVNGRRLIGATTIEQRHYEKRRKEYEKSREESDYKLRKKSMGDYQKRWDSIKAEDEAIKRNEAEKRKKMNRPMRRIR